MVTSSSSHHHKLGPQHKNNGSLYNVVDSLKHQIKLKESSSKSSKMPTVNTKVAHMLQQCCDTNLTTSEKSHYKRTAIQAHQTKISEAALGLLYTTE